jgi:hypothetical protein
MHQLMTADQQPLFPEIGILCLVPDEWGPRWMVRHHVMARLAKYFRVLWMNPAQHWRDALSGRHSSNAQANRDLPLPGFQVYVPPRYLPNIYRPEWLGRLLLNQRVRHARDFLVRSGCRRIILFLWRPEYEHALTAVPLDLSCYHLEDEYSFSDVDAGLDPQEARVLAKVSEVFILSPALLEKKGRINPHTSYVPGGVEFEEYATPAPEPPDLAPIPHPRIGYVGSIKKQLDWPLLLGLTKRHADWSFVLVGPVSPHPEISTAYEELKSRSNVYFLGGKPTREISAYPHYFDVCTMPYRTDDYTKFIYPLKLHEYLATGRPTIGSRIRSLLDYAEVVALVETPEEWSAAISDALKPDANTEEKRARRKEVARRHDWNLVVQNIAETIAQRLGISSLTPRKKL